MKKITKSVILCSLNIAFIHVATGDYVPLATGTPVELPMQWTDILEDIKRTNEDVTNCDYHRNLGSDDETPMGAENRNIVQIERRARKKKHTSGSKSASKRGRKSKNNNNDKSSKSGKSHESIRSTKRSKQIKKKKNKKRRSRNRNNYECSVDTTDGCKIPVPDFHQTCLEEYFNLPNDQNFVTTRFHLTLVQEATAEISGDDILALEQGVIYYFNDDFGSYDTEPMCVRVIEAALARKDNQDASGIVVLEAISFYMEMEHTVEGDDDSTRRKKTCRGEDKALCCPTAINGKCSCCCKKCGGRTRNKSLTDSISAETNFHPIHLRYVIDGEDTTNVAKCVINRFMEEEYEMPFSCADYARDDCVNNGGDPWDSDDIICH